MSVQPQKISSGTSTLISERKAIDITIEHLGKKFSREWIFRDFTYTFRAGHVYAITGPNGSGKSTLLQILWGQMPPSTGTLKYNTSQGEIPVDEIFRHVSIATPYLDLIDEFTLLEQIQFHFKLKPRRYDLSDSEILERMYLTHASGKTISNFSSGMRQRVKLALAFFSQAEIVFLDEPGTNLDATAFEWYKNELETLPKECLVFIASNQASEYPANAQKIDTMGIK